MVRRHIPVLGPEVLHYLQPEGKNHIVDGTVGDGGHAELILKLPGFTGRVLGIDRDAEVLARTRRRLAPFGDRVVLVHGNYSQVGRILTAHGWPTIDGFLLDLGMSSFQLDNPDRGFSFQSEGPLDMRMDRREAVTAAELLARLSDRELLTVFREFGEERRSKQILRAIRKAQSQHPIKTTRQLAKILSSAVHASRASSIHPATRSFQALRIAVNRELEHLEACLQVSTEYLACGGRMAVISFHSLEDRLVKTFFRAEAKGCICPPKIPVCVCGRKPRLRVLTRRVIRPGAPEEAGNPRASSARLRAAERIHAA